MTRRALPPLAVALAALAGCATPAEVEARYGRLEAERDAAVAAARAWDTHTLGIPASGWVVIIILAVLIVGALAAGAMVWGHHAMVARHKARAAAAANDHAVRLQLARRPTCPVCAHDPSIPARGEAGA